MFLASPFFSSLIHYCKCNFLFWYSLYKFLDTYCVCCVVCKVSFNMIFMLKFFFQTLAFVRKINGCWLGWNDQRRKGGAIRRYSDFIFNFGYWNDFKIKLTDSKPVEIFIIISYHLENERWLGVKKQYQKPCHWKHC